MSTFVLLPGAGSNSWYWQRVVPLLEDRGHDVVAVDLPYADENADQDDYADLVVAGLGDVRRPLVVVGQSMSAFTAVRVAQRCAVDELVLVAPMIPAPGESPAQWWGNVGHEEAQRAEAVADGRDPDAPLDMRELFFHDVPEDLTEEALTQEEIALSDAAFEPSWDAERWPDVPVRVVAGSRDRLFPLPFLTELSRARVGTEPLVVDSGHLVALARPAELAGILLDPAAHPPGSS
ncbi:alpha/beta fold hydrolase [Rhodococcus coprophilus]|uniref:Putative hydrolase n=1 Tax=Rhodococcus coprophilus TaxID=38310 RepID=A0A2X4UFP7_9NOCA|nr:alpha/beta fold hydrolase [Rhodococcus coprophilus]MBM7460170.1 pimeloyl-ACP methyl ester carboxylesterase [Rhodococcus coprophilus]SQI38716.1 putative hydrolase [Rhodococcus coprophilus]